jgi:hypothetical protein
MGGAVFANLARKIAILAFCRAKLRVVRRLCPVVARDVGAGRHSSATWTPQRADLSLAWCTAKNNTPDFAKNQGCSHLLLPIFGALVANILMIVPNVGGNLPR